MFISREEARERLEYEIDCLFQSKKRTKNNKESNDLNDAIIECEFEYKLITNRFYVSEYQC